MSPERNKKKKRGVILLIVVSLLTLMVLIGVTFVLFANRSLLDANQRLRIDEYHEPPEKMFEQVVGQLLYDTVARSALRGHSLLEDLYGPDFITGQVTSVTPTGTNPYNDNGDQWPNDPNPAAPPVGQAFAFQCTLTPANQVMPWLDYYTGRVITFTSGNAVGHSTRILQYDPGDVANGIPPRLHIESIQTSQFTFLVPAVPDTFIINGAPCNGTGAGFDDTNVAPPNPPVSVLNMAAVYAHQSVSNLPAIPSGDLVALLPHFNGYDPRFGQVFLGVGIAGVQNSVPINQGLARGGFDEPWDAADYQNMFLAMQPPMFAVQNSDTDPTNNFPLLPSFHRPDLVNYWVNYMLTTILSGLTSPAEQYQVMAQPYGPDGVRNTADEGAAPWASVQLEERDRVYNITRCSIFRPMPWDHPNFSGSNPALTGTNWQQFFNVLRGLDPSGTVPNQNLYDVDNDNDGLPDSIWVDAGLPVVTMPDGKRYKRLFAIMVQDLDGRIDLNAHGNLAQVARQEIPPASGQFHLLYRPQYPVPGNFGLALGPPANATPIYLPRGVGFGPAEVDFLNLFMNPPSTAFTVNPALAATVNGPIASYENILRGRYSSGLAGDNGLTAFPGAPGAFDPLNQIKHHGVPNDYATWGAWYASPPDVWGRGAVVLDWGGQPLYAPFAGVVGEMQDNPYELKLSGELSDTDSPYTLVELERMLRYHDHDTQRLVSRPLLPEANGGAGSVLAANAPGIIGPDHTARQRMSGRTSNIPAPSGILPGTQLLPQSATTFPISSWRAVGAPFGKLPGNTTILDMYAAKIRFVGGAPTPAAVNNIMNQLVPWEIRHGGKFDLNRWLGNGFDSVGLPGAPGVPSPDLVADDPVEAYADPLNVLPTNAPPYIGPREPGWVAPAQFASATTAPAEHSNGIDVNNDSVPSQVPGNNTQRSLDRMLARQLYARHLYCLATLFIDPTFDPPMPHEPTLNQAQRRELFLRRIAQWAINVVDYRDSDAIMTPFEYDINPWNGWQVDSNPATDGSGAYPELYAAVPGGPLVPVMWSGLPPNNNERRLVWGVEEPDLLITETLAFHSRNVKDTDVAGPVGAPADTKRTDATTPDETLDQFRVPQGSLFIEFYCPRSYRWQAAPANQAGNQKPRLPLELYDVNGFLQLGRFAPGGRPVWRLALSPLIEADPTNTFKARHPNTLAGVRTDRDPDPHLESSSFDWQDTSLLTYPGGPTPPAPVAPLAQFRYAYFGNASALPIPELAQSFHNLASSEPNVAIPGAPLLAPGGYAVLGPRPVTYLGSCTPVTPNLLWESVPNSINGYSQQRIELNSTAAPNVCTVYDTANALTTRTPGTDIRDVVSIIADYQGTPSTMVAGVATPWTRAWTSGLNITEPLMLAPGTNYYPEPSDPAGFTTAVPTPDPGWYDDPDTNVSAATRGFLQIPVEGTDDGNPVTANDGRPIYDNGMQGTGTYEDVSSVYLQRLANPNLPWNPLPTDPVYGGSFNGSFMINPYITVDWASIDVTVFAGDENTDQQITSGEWLDAPDDEDPSNTDPVTAFRSRQRAYQQGYTSNPATLIPQGSQQSPWSPVTRNTNGGGPYGATPQNAAATAPYFKVDLSNDLNFTYDDLDRHTFGSLNAGLGYPSPPQPAAPVPPPPFVRPYLGEPLADNPATPLQEQDPAPFPWLTFNNRPFANPYEIMMVPASAPSRLALEMTPGYLSQTHVIGSPVTPSGSDPNPYFHLDDRSLRFPYGHLLNFFHTEDTGPKPAVQSMPLPALPPAMSPHFHRIFDYVEVPSPFSGAERWFNPATGQFDNAGLYRPPFNKLSRFRDAGRININTIFDDQILISAMGHFPGKDGAGSLAGSFADKVFRSRQGYGPLGTPSFVMNPNFPTMFANPFRPLDAADLMPDVPANNALSMRKDGQAFPPPPALPAGRRTMPVDATFFRADPDAAALPLPLGTPRDRLFDQIANETAYPNLANDYDHIYRNTDRNAYFRYQVMQKLGSTFSTNSNCFAVWMTIGFFEVEDNVNPVTNLAVVDAAHPDGLRLGQEIGADSGEIVRHRAFYIIDRSIPVGHAPGQKLNSENCILLRRLIE